jgi:hypothetical protein
MRTRTALIGALLAGVVAVGAVIPALAQDDADTTEQGTDEQDIDEQDTDTTRGRSWGPHHDEFVAALAEELGLPESEVSAAIDAVTEQLRSERQAQMQERLEERLAAAIEAGDLTQEQADAILDAHESGALPSGRGGWGGAKGHGSGGPGMHGRAMLDG